MSNFGDKPTRTRQTDTEYRKMWAFKKFTAEHLNTEFEPNWPWATAKFADENFQDYKSRTVRKYIAAATAAARLVWGEYAAEQCSEGFYAAKKKLELRGGRRKPRTSDSKAKFFPEGDVNAIRIGFRSLNSAEGDFYGAWFELQYITGCRPNEVWSIEVDDSGPWTLVWIENAKNSNGRSHGPTRTQWFNDPDKSLKQIFLELVHTLDHHALVEVAPANSVLVKQPLLKARYATAFARISKAAFPDMERKPTPYTLRHQFAADCKLAGKTPTEIAALMGHSVNNTVFNHYEHGRRGRARGQLPKGDPKDMARVKDKFTPNPFVKKVAAPTFSMREM